MKILIFVIATVFSAMNAQANHSSVLNLKMLEHGNFSVVLDERPSYARAGFFTDEHVEPGYHKLKVVRLIGGHYGQPMIKQLVYKGWINIPPGSVVFANIDCHSRFDIVKVEPKFCPPSGGGHGHGHGNNNGWGVPPPPMCMAPEIFLQLKSIIASKAFDGSRLELAREALAYNYFTSGQVAELTGMFSFDSSRLEFAKSAFDKTIDKQNYFVVNDAFTFSGSIRELNEFISGRG